MTFSWYNLFKQIVKKEAEFSEQNNVVIDSEKYFMQYRFILAGFNALIFWTTVDLKMSMINFGRGSTPPTYDLGDNDILTAMLVSYGNPVTFIWDGTSHKKC